MNFEDAGAHWTGKWRSLADFLENKLRPATRQDLVSLCPRASDHLAELANRLEDESDTRRHRFVGTGRSAFVPDSPRKGTSGWGLNRGQSHAPADPTGNGAARCGGVAAGSLIVLLTGCLHRHRSVQGGARLLSPSTTPAPIIQGEKASLPGTVTLTMGARPPAAKFMICTYDSRPPYIAVRHARGSSRP